MDLLENINNKLSEIKTISEIYLPHKGDYEARTSVSSYSKSREQKMNWKKNRNKIQSGIDRNARNNYTQGIYQKENNKEKAYRK